ncbi:MAG: GNAT family N-acetyltransferase [Rhodoferax sp.]|nr:GNAT family N-acetyltransferase [Rhodoferax sp.]
MDLTTPLTRFTNTEIESLERATLDAVAPACMEERDSWLIPLDETTIGRAKSAVPLRHDNIAIADINAIENRYQARGLPAAFRIADVAGLAPIHAELRRLGYAAQQPTLFLTGKLEDMRSICHNQPATVSVLPTPAWSEVYLSDGFDPIDGAHRVQALSRSRHVVYACVQEAGHSVAAGTASLNHGWVGIHGMRTLPSHRKRGLAKRVLAGLADSALSRNLTRVYLQVEEENQAALGLYHRAGFQTAWLYHYWRKV